MRRVALVSQMIKEKVQKLPEEVIVLLVVLLSIFAATFVSWAGVANTITAATETEICVFCHIPHDANPAVPLWSHAISNAAYTMYNSDYLQRFSYDIPTELGTYPSTGYRSRLCLSCHDGTVAIGNVYVLRGTPLTAPINMQGVTAEGKLPTTSSAYIGTDLTNDHPVAIKYDTTKDIIFGSGEIRDIELNASPPPINPKPYENVKLFSPSPGYVECPSCHDPHTENEKFLAIWNTNLAMTIDDMCATCHDKVNWTSSTHNTSAVSYSGTDVQSAYGVNAISSLGCTNCHLTHGGQGSPYWYILRQVEEATCFKGAANLSSDAPCSFPGRISIRPRPL
jgi:predicted CXXCH cytochrome family protein